MINRAKTLTNKVLRPLGFEMRQLRPEETGLANYRDILRFLYFQKMFGLIEKVEGEIVECGVGRGHSLRLLAFLAREEGQRRKLWGFDSFEGFPEPSLADQSTRGVKRGEWGNTSIPHVKALLLEYGLDSDFVGSQVTLVKGFFDESLPKFRGASIGLLHLDVDLYDSYLACLKALYPLVRPGGVIMFDEYLGTMEHVYWPGAQKAIDEYLGEKKSLISRDGPTGKYYLVKPQDTQ